MLSIFKGLFGHSDSSIKQNIYSIQVNDEEINRSLIKIIKQIQQEILLLKNHLSAESTIEKDEELQELFEKMLQIKASVKELSLHVEKIIEIEMSYKDFFIIKDDTFLGDKRQQLGQMMNAINAFIEIVQQKPSINELREELFDKLVYSINALSSSINQILKDDENLRVIYKRIKEI